ncbi:type II secretion system protein GspL [Endozoicomonas ascidiicola]|uniref:type II secretion system protein GspL n=1 Tax=Endozoicomonas ascidiicola TaxID=1698521 RepID=UPI00082AAF9D|nr:type II secretion system protein GspL [Endozoicomonas ascidiicola]
MARNLFIRPEPLACEFLPTVKVDWVWFDEASEEAIGQGQCNFSELMDELSFTQKEQPEGEQLYKNVVVLLSSNQVCLKRLAINKSQRKHIKTALPFMVEEELAEDIGNLHFVHQLTADFVLMAAINHGRMDQLLSTAADCGIPVTEVIAESQLLSEFAADDFLILAESQRWWLKPPNQLATMLPACLVEEAVHSVVNDASEKSSDQTELPQLRTAQFAGDSDEAMWSRLKSHIADSGLNHKEESQSNSYLLLLTNQYARQEVSPLNLRSGQYRCELQRSNQKARWKPLIAAVLAGLVIHFSIMVGKGWVLEDKAEAYWQKNTALYLSVYQHDRQVKQAAKQAANALNIRRRMESRLKAEGGGTHTVGLLSLLSRTGKAINSLENHSLITRSLDFNVGSNRLTLEFTAGSLEEVDLLLASMKEQQLSAQLAGANQEDGAVSARMVLTL